MTPGLTKVGATVGLWIALSHGVVVEGAELKPQIERAPAPFTMPENHPERPGIPWQLMVGSYPSGYTASASPVQGDFQFKWPGPWRMS